MIPFITRLYRAIYFSLVLVTDKLLKRPIIDSVEDRMHERWLWSQVFKH